MTFDLSTFSELSILKTGKATNPMHDKLKSLMDAMRKGKTVVTPVMRFNEMLVFATVTHEHGEFGEWTVRVYKPDSDAVAKGFKHARNVSPSVTMINTNSVSRAYMVVFGQLGIPYQYIDIAPEDDTMTLLEPAQPATLALLEKPKS